MWGWLKAVPEFVWWMLLVVASYPVFGVGGLLDQSVAALVAFIPTNIPLDDLSGIGVGAVSIALFFTIIGIGELFAWRKARR